MKTAVIGTGKTGSRVVELLGSELSEAFDQDNPPTSKKLKESDVAIIFVPGSAVPEIISEVEESGIPAVWGSTGYDWSDDLDKNLKDKGLRWIIASNFSLGMNIIRKCIQAISKGSEILPDPEFSIHEVHHLHKQDAPSGTALSWKEWLNKDADISSERKGDVKGIHQLEMKTEFESIFLQHQALDRAVFASGAIWAARRLLEQPNLKGLFTFAEIFDQAFKGLGND